MFPFQLLLRFLLTARRAFAAGLGCGAHSDSGALTLLLQSPGVNGLQALAPDGTTWLDVPPLPGTLVLNLGELLQLVTGGYFKATVHRVVPPRDERPRLSAPFFYNADYDSRIAQPLDLPPELPWTVRAVALILRCRWHATDAPALVLIFCRNRAAAPPGAAGRLRHARGAQHAAAVRGRQRVQILRALPPCGVCGQPP